MCYTGKMNNYAQFKKRLETSLNQVAASCSSYAREYEEGIPPALSAQYGVLSAAWDAHAVIVDADPRYTHPAGLPYVGVEDGYRKYLQEVLYLHNPYAFDKFLYSKLPKELRWK